MAAAPPNDAFANRIDLGNTSPVTANGSNVDATVETGEPKPNSATNSVWWRWTAPSSGLAEINTTGSLIADFPFPLDTELAVYTGTSLTGLIRLAENDDSGVLATSLVKFPAVAGTTYVIQVGGINGDEGSIKLAISVASASLANDAFANAVSLSTGVAATGSTVGSTLQTGEPVPPGIHPAAYGGSAWWAWTAPAAGWYRLVVDGGADGTAASIWSGSVLNALQPVHSNLTGTAASVPLYFQATAGTRYPMAVGWTANPGASLSLTVNPVAAPPASLNSLTVSALAVDVTDAAAAVDATFNLVSTLPFQNGSITQPWMNMAFNSRVFNASRRISGTATDGTYQVTLNLPRYLPPGPYRISRVSTSFTGGTGLDFGELSEAPFPAGASRTINVLNSGPVDNDSPTLARVELSPASVDVLNGDRVVTVVLQIIDPLAGFHGLWLELTGNGKSLVSLVDSSHRTAGTAQDGTYTVPITIHQDEDPGDYHLKISQVRDTLANKDPAVYDSTDPLFPGPFTGTVHVTKTGGTANPIDTWAAAQGLTGPDAEASADTDHDEILLETEFAMGTDPRDGRIQYFRPDAAGLPVGDLTGSGASRRLRLEFWIPDDPTALKLTYTAQFSSNGTTWTDVPQAAFLINAGSSLASSTGIRRRCTVLDPTAYSEGVTRNGRIRVTLNP